MRSSRLRRLFTALACVIGAYAASTATRADEQATRRPNIVVILADPLRADDRPLLLADQRERRRGAPPRRPAAHRARSPYARLALQGPGLPHRGVWKVASRPAGGCGDHRLEPPAHAGAACPASLLSSRPKAPPDSRSSSRWTTSWKTSPQRPPTGSRPTARSRSSSTSPRTPCMGRSPPTRGSTPAATTLRRLHRGTRLERGPIARHAPSSHGPGQAFRILPDTPLSHTPYENAHAAPAR